MEEKRQKVAVPREKIEDVIDTHWTRLSLVEVASVIVLSDARQCTDYVGEGQPLLRVYSFPENDEEADDVLVKLPSGCFYRVPGWRFVEDTLAYGYRIVGTMDIALQSTPVRLRHG